MHTHHILGAVARASRFPVRSPLATAMLLAAIGQSAQAADNDQQNPQATALSAVTVTATRREASLQEVPVAVSVVQGEQLERDNRNSVASIVQQVPTLNYRAGASNKDTSLFIRGVGTISTSPGVEPTVATVVDGVVFGRPGQSTLDLLDLERIEVLRGPQGTLFGRNSPAGVIKFDSAKPVFKTEGYLQLGIGSFSAKTAEGVFNTAVSDTVALRFSGTSQHRDNRVHNTNPTAGKGTQDFEGYGDQAFRLQALVQPNKDFSALFNVHARNYHGNAALFRANIIKKGTNDLVDGFDYGSYASDGVNEQDLETKGGSIRLKYTTGDITLHSITGYEKLKFYSRADVDGGYGASYAPPYGPGYIPFAVETADVLPNHRQFSQEFRAESNYSGPLQWIGGLFYFDENIQIDSISFDSIAAGNPQRSSYAVQFQDSKSYAAFGSLNYTVSDKFKVRGGVRYTSDKKDFRASRVQGATAADRTDFNLKDTSHNVSWDLSGTYELNKTTNLFARIATGYRAPSMQGRLDDLTSVPSSADAEKALSYEAGIKQDLFDRRARLSASVFDYRMKNKQLTAGNGTVNMNQLINADKVTGRGVELDFQANLSDEFSMTAGYSYNDTEIKDKSLIVQHCGNNANSLNGDGSSGCTPTNFSPRAGYSAIDGNPLPRAPKHQLNFTLKYSTEIGNGEFYAMTDWAYRTSYNFFLYEAPEYKAKKLTEGGVRAAYKWSNGKYEVAAFGRNITDRRVILGAIDFDNLTGILNEPRTWGGTFKVTF